MARTINQAGEELIKKHEGLVLSAYPDPDSELGKACRAAHIHLSSYQDVDGWDQMTADPWTIGWGHTGADVYQGLTIDEDQAEAFFQHDILWAETDVNSAVTSDISDNAFAALVDFTFNVGHIAGTTLIEKVNEGDMQAAAAELMRWIYSHGQIDPGLRTRRTEEAQLLLTPDDE